MGLGLLLLTGGFLSLHSPARAATISGTHTLSTPVTTDPSSISGLIVQLDATQIAQADGSAVTTWSNLAGGSVGDFGVTGGTQPLYASSSNLMNGLPLVHFRNSAVLTNPSNFGNDVTVMYVGRLDGGQNRRLVGGTANNWLLGYWGGSQDQAYFNGWVSPGGGIPTDYNTHVYEATIAGAGQNSIVYSNGVQLYSNQGGVTGPNGLTLGGYSTGSEQSYGSIGEVLVFDHVLSTTDRQSMEQYLQGKWYGDSSLPPTEAVTITATGTLDLNGVNQTIGSLAGEVGGQVLLNAGYLTIGQNDTSTTYSGDIADGSVSGGGVRKTGNGTLILGGTASNTYTGNTVLASGRLGLSKTGGAYAINGDFIGVNNASPDVYATQDNQFAPGSVMYFQNYEGDHVRFELLGTTQTLAGIDNAGAGNRGVIQHREQVPVAAVDGLSTLVLNGTGNYTFNGYLRSTGGTLELTKNGTGTQTLSGGNIYHTGTTTVNDGTLKLVSTTNWRSNIDNSATVEFNADSGSWALWSGGRSTFGGSGDYVKSGGGTVQFYNDTITASGQFLIQGGVLTNNGNSTIWSGSTADMDISATAVLDLFADAIYVNELTGLGTVRNNYGNSSNYSGSSAFTEKFVIGVNNGTSTFNGTITDTGIAEAGSNKGLLELEKTGTGIITLAGANGYTGTTTVSAGTLSLDYSTQDNSKLSDSAALILGGGTLDLTGGSHTEVVGSTTLNAGASAVTRTSGSATLAMGAITRNAGAAIDFSAGSIATTTTANDATGILGDWATIGSDWAANDGSDNIVAYTGYTNGNLGDGGVASNPAINFQPSGAQTSLSTAKSFNTLNLTGSIGATMTGGGSVTLAGGGLLANITGLITGGTLMGSASGELAVTTVADLNISSTIADNGGATGLIKSGAGTLTLTGVNTFGGGTTVNQGMLQFSGAGTLGSTGGTLTVNTGGTLNLNGTSQGVGNFTGTGGSIHNNATAAGVTLTIGNGNGTGGNYAGVIADHTSGTGTVALTKTGTGTLTLSGTNTYSDGTTISDGILRIGSNGTTGTLGSGPVDIGSGTTLQIYRSNNFTLSNDLSGSGTIYKYNSNTVTYDGNSTLSGKITLAGGAFTLASGGTMTEVGILEQITNTTATWNINGTLSATTFYGAKKTANHSSHYSTLNVNAGGVATIGTAYLSYNGYDNYGTVQTTINVNNGGILNVTNLLGWPAHNSGGLVTVRRNVNVNAGGRLNATTIDFSTQDNNNTTIRLLTINDGALANLPGGNLTVDSTTPITLTGNGTFDADDGHSITVNGVVQGGGNLVKTGAGTLQLIADSTYAGSTAVNAGTFLIDGRPAAYYSFDNTSGNTIYNDGTLASKDGTLQDGAGLTTAGGGHVGEGMTIADNSNQRLELASPVDIAAGWTVASWFNNLHPIGQWRTLSRGSSSDHQAIVHSSSNDLGSYVSSFAFRDSGYDLLAGQGWHHIAAVGSGSTTDMYIDGVYVGTSDRKSTTDVKWIGNHSAGQPFAEIIDEFHVYQRALSADEVLALYNTGVAPMPADAIPDGSAVTVAGGAALSLFHAAETIGSLAGPAGSQVLLDAGALTTGDNGDSTTFSGEISGAGGLTKTGDGVFKLHGINTYTGETVIDAGTLQVTGSLATSNITVDGGTFTGGSGKVFFNLGTDPDQMTLLDGELNISTLAIEFVGATDLNQYTVVDYSAGGTLTKNGSDIFGAVINLPSGMELVDNGTGPDHAGSRTLHFRPVRFRPPRAVGLATAEEAIESEKTTVF
jgi:autotransporter-associated beta strand protein